MSKETSEKVASIAGRVLHKDFHISELSKADARSLAASALVQAEPDDVDLVLKRLYDETALGEFIRQQMAFKLRADEGISYQLGVNIKRYLLTGE